MIKVIFYGKTLEHTEKMMKIMDLWARFHFNTYGGHRDTSYNIGDSHEIQTTYDIDLNYIIHGVLHEICKTLQETITWDCIGTTWIIEEEGQ